jgi:hypothetical protein
MKKETVLNLDPSSVHVRLGMCAAALVGTAAAAPNVEAVIITFNTPIVVPPTLAGVYVVLETGVTGFSAGATPGWDFNPYAASGLTTLGFYWAPGGAGGVASGTTYVNVAPGTTIGPASTFTNVILGTAGSPFLTTGTHILGFRFVNAAAVTNYGYMTMTNTGGGSPNGFPTTIVSWSFENNGGSITVPIPEPATAALLSMGAIALGAAGLRQWRRQRAA